MVVTGQIRKKDDDTNRLGRTSRTRNHFLFICSKFQEVEMANRKEDEKNERIIRGLLKLTENRRCINCNSMGPQYVCTNFWTFVCTTYSGIYREFTHRVKSVSMAKFTSQEVIALQEGGNKHQLAARVAASFGTCIEVKVYDEKLALLLSKL
ncbi:hypothetical protein CMV_020251 [Castanea mollissima]|uniref:Arf-GAP domain-containing protein n=1 Tax=Castanea mollissima TaxID=60419 RepID=A0A8J4QNI5_9ROSI|nr:hypothetical protein CMV_020251 [Castanea mollissima]